MGIAVAFFVPLFVVGSTRDKAELWVDFIRETAKTFGVDCYLHGADKPLGVYAEKQGCYLADSLHDLLGELVMLDTDGQDLAEFEHPVDATYLLGPDDWPIPPPGGAKRIGIPTPSNYPLWGAVAVGICLNDRLIKNYQFSG